MRDGSIILVKGADSGDFFQRLVNKAIEFFTKSPYVHVKVYFEGKTRELTVPKYVETDGYHIDSSMTVYEPYRDLTEEERRRANYWLSNHKQDHYNYFKLVILALVYPTRHLWRAIGWFPFSNRYVWGDVCSGFADDFYRHGLGIDLFPDDPESYTSPGDFTDSWFLVKGEE